MAEAIARTTLNKARYFLSQAEIHQSDSDTTASRLPFVANLEAAISTTMMERWAGLWLSAGGPAGTMAVVR